MAVVPQQEYQLDYATPDSISRVVFAPGHQAGPPTHLLAASWDSTVRLYDVHANEQRAGYEHDGPVLDCCFLDRHHAYSAGVDRQVKLYDFGAEAEAVLGSHDDAVRCVEFCSEVNVLITGGRDKTVKLWDPRMNSSVGSFSQPYKVYSMAVCGDLLIVGTAGRHVLVWDLRQMGYVQQRRETSLKYQTRAIRAFPTREGYVLSSEGRVAVEYLNPSPDSQKRKYAFKCHRVKHPETGKELIYPVNAIAFHQQHGTFATGGSDGFVNVWDGNKKKRLCQFHEYPTSISSLAFSDDGSLVAIATSYLWEQGEAPAGTPPPGIFIRPCTEAETKPK